MKFVKTKYVRGTCDKYTCDPRIGMHVAIRMIGQLADNGWCRDAESNCGHKAFQASALPTELSRRWGGKISKAGPIVNKHRQTMSRQTMTAWQVYLLHFFYGLW